MKIHCSRLSDLEYLLIHYGGRGKSLVYELLYDDDLDDKKHLMGLIDPERLSYDEKQSGQQPGKSAPSQGQVSLKSGPGQGSRNSRQSSGSKASSQKEAAKAKNVYIDRKQDDASYVVANGSH